MHSRQCLRSQITLRKAFLRLRVLASSRETIGYLILLIAYACCACSREHAVSKTNTFSTTSNTSSASSLARGNESTIMAVRFLEDRIEGDPDDLVALNKLSGYYLQLHKETENLKYLESALRSAQASLRILPVDQNLGGLQALAQAEFETHNFVSARRHAKELTEYQPQKPLGYQLLGDASLEVGDYKQAEAAYQVLEKLAPSSVATESRLAHLALLRGDLPTAKRRYFAALQQAKTSSIPSAEIIAWCSWQIGELYFTNGDYEGAENHYREALSALADYPHAVTSLARVRAARGDLKLAIELYESVVQKQMDPVDAAALGDLYKVVGRDSDAAQMYGNVERLSQLNSLNTVLHNRQLIWFWANHDQRPHEAYIRAKKEYEVRRDVYGADALAWSALKAGKIAEASLAMNEALRLGTRDPILFYHAGMIARAARDDQKAREYLRRALEISPLFDPLQAPIAKRTLESTN
jgi:tetratricopeptide (TPR) repeat protein